MRRQTRSVPFARMRIDTVLRKLAAQPVADWRKPLRLAWEILANKRGVDGTTARAVLFASLSAAHCCGQAIDQRSRANVSAAANSKLHNMFAVLRDASAARRPPSVVFLTAKFVRMFGI